MAGQTVLVVEDEENLVAALKFNLEREGYVVRTASDGEQGLSAARSSDVDLVVLDLMLPRMDGFEVCRLLRKESNVPVLMLTAKGEEVDRVVGLELGADDYLTKPFGMRELLARVRALLRRAGISSTAAPEGTPGKRLTAASLEIDLGAHTASLGGKPLELRPREFDLLALLMANKGHAFTREQVLERVWGPDWYGDARTVDVHVRWLREKLEAEPSNPTRIVTVRGVGYRFEG